MDKKLMGKELNLNIATADGQKQTVIGVLTSQIKYKDESKNVKFYIIPDLTQELILGIDFWREFKIEIVSKIEMIEKLNSKELDPDMHDLPKELLDKLEYVKRLFPDSETEGLGRTKLIEHDIELLPNTKPIKQRYFPISPAIEKILHKEVDEMLQLGVIEEAPNCPWASPVVLIRKPNKIRLCLDSSYTVKDAYPLSHIDGILSRISQI